MNQYTIFNMQYAIFCCHNVIFKNIEVIFNIYIGSLVELILVIMQELEAELLSIPRLDVVDDGRLAMR